MFIVCRFVAVWLPHQAKTWNTVKNARRIIIALYTVMGAFLGYWCSWADRLVDGVCVPNAHTPGQESFTGGFLVFGLSLYAFIPSLLLAVLNSMIIYKMNKQQQKFGSSRAARTMSKPAKRLTKMMLWLSISFIVLVTPISAAHLYAFVNKTRIFESTNASMLIYLEVSSFMEQLNSAINFVYYAWHDKSFVERMKRVVFRTKDTAVAPKSVMMTSRHQLHPRNEQAALHKTDGSNC